MKKKISGILALIMFLSVFVNTFSIKAEATENYVTAIREVNPSVITPDGEAEVKIKVTGTPPVNVVKPNDVVLILDKSESMQYDNKFEAMKDSAKEFVDLMDFSKHNLGMVDFSYAEYSGTKGLTNDPNSLKSYIDGIECVGGTDTGYAIREAAKLLKSGRSDAQPVIVLLTDGQANSSSDALKAAEEAKNAGIVFYTVALLAPGENADTSAPNLLLRDMATTAKHHSFVLGSVGLIDIYRAIVKEIGIASAYNVKITEEVSPEFEIVPGSYDNNIPKPQVDGNTLTWNILELKADTLELSYKIRPKSDTVAGKYNVASEAVITYKNHEGNEQTYNIPNKVLEIKNHPPVITSVTNNSSHVNGGEKIIIKGSNFSKGARVKINNSGCTNVVFVDSNTIEAVTPPGVKGDTTLTVINDDNQKATADFSYYGIREMTITKITPNSGSTKGGEYVSIEGSNFVKGNELSVEIGGNKSDHAYVDNSTKIRVKIPANSTPGKYDVVVTNGDGQKLTVKEGYEYLAPPPKDMTITKITPNSGSTKGGEYVSIEGTNFVKGNELSVEIGGNKSDHAYVDNSTKIRVKIPANSTPGKYDVVVTNGDGQKLTVKEGYEYLAPPSLPPLPAPTISQVTPNVGSTNGGEFVYIEGTNFVKGDELSVEIGGNKVNVFFVNSNKIRIKTPANSTPGKYDVVVTNGDGQKVTIKEGYEYIAPPPPPAPTISQITPNVGSTNGGDLVYIEGTNFVNGDELSVEIGGNKVKVNYMYGPNKIRIKTPANSTPGKYDVVLTNGDGQKVTIKEGYEYIAPLPPAPTISQITPNVGSTNGGDFVYIEGTNFVNGDKLSVEIGENKVNVFFVNSNKIRIKTPANNTPGKYDVVVTNGDGQKVTVKDGYEYVTP